MSPSSRRAWIEMDLNIGIVQGFLVALLAEGVDRNSVVLSMSTMHSHVALLAEGVDRNYEDLRDKRNIQVALLAEGVDRN